MSYNNYEAAMALARRCRFYTTAGGKSEEEIRKAERALGITFSRQSHDFYKKYGYLSFFGCEIFGIDAEDESGIVEGNSVSYAIRKRNEQGLPESWLPIYNFGDGSMAYLDYDDLNAENEPRVIEAEYNGQSYTNKQVVAEDFGDFVLEMVQDQLETQTNQA